MRSLIPIVLVLTLSGPAAATQLKMVKLQPGVMMPSPGAQVAGLSPSLRSWVATEARATIDRGAEPDASVIAGNARARLAGQDFNNADIETLVQLVMRESERQAQADLREMMEQVKAVNERKARAREAAAVQREAKKGLTAAARAEYAGPETRAVCVDPPCQFAVPANSNTDSMSDMGETNQLRLQMHMDRRAKFIETVSNIMKKSSDTASTITSNLK